MMIVVWRRLGHLKKICRKSPRWSRDQNRDKLNVLEEENVQELARYLCFSTCTIRIIFP